jgi:uncharacterized protein YjbI with pentapeptide repeats
MDQQELKNVLELHRKWLMGEASGKRANLSSADLSSANLRSADLSYADLSYANLSSANLRSADLSYADLSYANLSSANLSYANLSSANLSSANLSSANLSYANLSSADLSYANLSSANLRSADLRSADLSYAELGDIKKDFFKRLFIAKDECEGLYDAIIRGKINGSSYFGECACFVGTIAKIRKEGHEHLGIKLKPDSASATERWFMGIATGETPQSNQVSKITSEWIEEFAKEKGIDLPTYKLVSSKEFPRAFK